MIMLVNCTEEIHTEPFVVHSITRNDGPETVAH